MRNQVSNLQHHLGIDTIPGLLNEQHNEWTINRALALGDSRNQLRPHNMRDIQVLSGALPLLPLTEEKHVHEIRVNLVQIPDAREKSLSEDTVKNIQIGRQLIGLLLCLMVDP